MVAPDHARTLILTLNLTLTLSPNPSPKLNFPPHLKGVATIPCEIQTAKLSQITQKYNKYVVIFCHTLKRCWINELLLGLLSLCWLKMFPRLAQSLRQHYSLFGLACTQARSRMRHCALYRPVDLVSRSFFSSLF